MTNNSIPACPIWGIESTHPDGGTKIKNLPHIDGGHDIDCKVDGQNMLLKSEFMKKV
jgi:uncharacterized Zn ribbon protein